LSSLLHFTKFYYDKIKEDEKGWASIPLGKTRNAYKILVKRSESRILLKRPRSRWEDNIKRNLREIVFAGVNWIHLA
jgi:hypothetical protein